LNCDYASSLHSKSGKFKDAFDLIANIFKKYPIMRLGGGPKGSDLDFPSMISHPFFNGISFGKLKYLSPPLKAV